MISQPDLGPISGWSEAKKRGFLVRTEPHIVLPASLNMSHMLSKQVIHSTQQTVGPHGLAEITDSAGSS